MKPAIVIRPDGILTGVSMRNRRGRLTLMQQDERGRWRPIRWQDWPVGCARSTVYIVEDGPVCLTSKEVEGEA